MTTEEKLARCDREIAKAQAEANKPHTEMEHAGIAIWECDWLSERERLLEEKA